MDRLFGLKSETAAERIEISENLKYFFVSKNISSAVITFTTKIFSSIKFKLVGPVISVTSAPKLAAVLAKEKPILPDEKLPMNLTASMGS